MRRCLLTQREQRWPRHVSAGKGRLEQTTACLVMLGETMRRQNKPRQALEPHFILLDRMKEHDELVHLTLMQDHVILIVTTILGQSGTYPRCPEGVL